MISFLDRHFAPDQVGILVNIVICGTLAAGMLFCAWWRDRPGRCIGRYWNLRCRSRIGHGGKHCAMQNGRLVFWGGS